MNIINHFKKKSNIDILKYLLIFALLNIVAIGLITLISQKYNDIKNIANYIIIYLQFILMLLPFKILNIKKEDIIPSKGSFIKSLKYSLLGYLIFILINLILVVSGLSKVLPGFGQQENIVDQLINTNLDIYVIGFAICILAPLVEEITFRGYIYNKFKDNYGIILSSLFTSVLFAGIHFQFQVISAMIILSLIIHWVYEKSGGLYGAITFHIINNTITFVVMSNL